MVNFLKSKQVCKVHSSVSGMEGAELTVPILQGSEEVTSSHYMLSEGVHAMAEIPPTDTVLLWLGVSLPISIL